MSCLHPLIRIPYTSDEKYSDYLTFEGKAAYLSGRYRVHNDAVIIGSRNGADPYLHLLDIQKTHPGAQMVPCQRCYACVLLQRAIWTQRLLAEAHSSDLDYLPYKPLFITLTYDQEHIKYKKDVSCFGGELVIHENVPTVCKQDVVDFLKRLNSHLRYEDRDFRANAGFPSYKLRYFACTEYGTRTGRPHAHLILFGVPFSMLCTRREMLRAGTFKRSQLLSSKWRNGFVSIAEAGPAMMQYVAGYCLKKADCYDYKAKIEQFWSASFIEWYDSKRQWLDDNGLEVYEVEDIFDPWSPPMKEYRGKLIQCTPDELIEKESRWGSKGLGRDWYMSMKKEIMRLDEDGRFSDKAVGLFKYPVRPASYFERLFEEDDPLLPQLKAQRHRDKTARLRLLTQTYTINEIHQNNLNNALGKFQRAYQRDNLHA